MPIVLTALTGCVYQLVDMAGQGESFDWLLDLHKGDFGILDLESIYPILNASGVLVLAGTGLMLWLQMKSRSHRHPNP